MKRILIAVAMMGMTGGAYAADFADLQSIKAREIKADAAEKAAVQPKAERSEVQLVPSVIVESMEKFVDTSADGERLLAEIHSNLEKAGLVYITGSVQPHYINETWEDASVWKLKVLYATKAAVPADTPRVLDFNIRVKGNAEEENDLKLEEIRTSLEKAGLGYISGEVRPYYMNSPEGPRIIEVDYARG